MRRRMLGDGYCARPVELDCHFESIRKSCSFFVPTIPPRHRRLSRAGPPVLSPKGERRPDRGGVGDGRGVQAVSTVSDGQQQPTPAPTPARRGEPTQVRTAADAATWPRQRATEFLTQAIIEPSPIHATARRRAGATLTALAVAIDREGRTDTATADALMHLARDYRQTHLADLRDPDFEDHQIVCGHLADTLTEVGTRLRSATAAERTRRARAAPQPHVTQRNL
jgi:hypothetical protein